MAVVEAEVTELTEAGPRRRGQWYFDWFDECSSVWRLSAGGILPRDAFRRFDILCSTLWLIEEWGGGISSWLPRKPSRIDGGLAVLALIMDDSAIFLSPSALPKPPAETSPLASPMDGSGPPLLYVEEAKDLTEPEVGKALRFPSITAVCGSISIADCAIGVALPAIGVCPSSAWEKNFALPPWSPNDVISFKAECLPSCLWGPRLTAGGESGGLRTSLMLGPMFWNVSWAAEGDAQGSVES